MIDFEIVESTALGGVLSTYWVLPEIFPQSRLVLRVGYDKEECKGYSMPRK
jgi:hypothetical protein